MKESPEYTTIKVPKPTIVAARRLQAELLRRGIDHLPVQIEEALTTHECPLCRHEMKEIASYRYLRCECGMGKQEFTLNDPGAELVKGIGIGALVGLGLFAVASMLGAGSPETQQRAADATDAVRKRVRRSSRRLPAELIRSGRRR